MPGCLQALASHAAEAGWLACLLARLQLEGGGDAGQAWQLLAACLPGACSADADTVKAVVARLFQQRHFEQARAPAAGRRAAAAALHAAAALRAKQPACRPLRGACCPCPAQVVAAYGELQAAGEAGLAVADCISQQAAVSFAHLGKAEEVGRVWQGSVATQRGRNSAPAHVQWRYK